jgi:hypothetical protein
MGNALSARPLPSAAQIGIESPSRGCSSMVEQQPSKLNTRVRFPSPAPALPVSFPQRERLRPACSFEFGRVLPRAAASSGLGIPVRASPVRSVFRSLAKQANRPWRLPMASRDARRNAVRNIGMRARQCRAASSKRAREGRGVNRSCSFAPRSSCRRSGGGARGSRKLAGTQRQLGSNADSCLLRSRLIPKLNSEPPNRLILAVDSSDERSPPAALLSKPRATPSTSRSRNFWRFDLAARPYIVGTERDSARVSDSGAIRSPAVQKVKSRPARSFDMKRRRAAARVRQQRRT